MKKFSFGASAFVAIALLMASGAQAQVPATAKCAAAKVKCVNNATKGLLGCHNKAEGKGVALDTLCTGKVSDKFNGATGCIGKADAKPPCPAGAGGAALSVSINNFVTDVVDDVDPQYPTPVLDKCSAGKKKCIGNKVKAILGCYQKNITKPDSAAFSACIAKGQAKFDGGADPAKGCFAKLEAKYNPSATPCQTSNDTAALETKVDNFAQSIVNDVNPPPVLSTLDFITGAPSGNCGNAFNAANTSVKTLSCGGLNIGGGGSIVSEGPTPDGSISRYAISCSGSSCTVSATSTAPALNSADPDCTNTGCNFGTPLPIPNAAIPGITTCVLNTFASPASGTLDTSSGATSINVNLSSDIYLTGNLAQPCPKCSASGTPSSPGTGTCDRGPRAGLTCVSTSSVGVTRDCPTGGTDGTHPCTPGGGACIDGSHVGAIGVNLSPLTSGTATSTNATGQFCAGQGTGTHAGCFGKNTCVKITENGSAPGALSAGVPTAGKLASTFCIAATGNGLVDASADLPGPGAVSLPGTFEVN